VGHSQRQGVPSNLLQALWSHAHGVSFRAAGSVTACAHVVMQKHRNAAKQRQCCSCIYAWFRLL